MTQESKRADFTQGPRIFLKWYPYDKRNDAIAKAMNASSHYVYCGSSGSAWTALWRYPLQLIKTVLLLVRMRPSLTFVTNPPIFAVLPVALYAWATSTPYIVDSHTGAFDHKWALFGFLHRLLIKRARLVMVTNQRHEQIYSEWGARPFVLSDVFLDISSCAGTQKHAVSDVAVVCSFAADEPIREILGAARRFPQFTFHITGNHKKMQDSQMNEASANVTFTGFLPDNRYFQLLADSDCIVTLTTRDDTMQNAAYEALSLKKPMVLSDSRVLRETYENAAVYVDNTADGICRGLIALSQNYSKYCQAADEMAERRKLVWLKKCAELNSTLASNQ